MGRARVMLEFKDITLEDKVWIDKVLEKKKYLSCEYCFGNHFIWKNAYSIQIARMDGFYIAALSDDEGETGKSFLYPAGLGDVKTVIEQLEEYCVQNAIAFRLHSASSEDIANLEALFPGKYSFTVDRGYSDYIYTVEKLTNLSGKKLHSKRNHIARFKENNWRFEEITNGNFKDCLSMNSEWCQINDCGRDQSLKEECCAITRSFKYFNELNFFGGLLRIDDKVVAYTIAERLNDDVVAVHMEKAFSDIQGAYPAINREFVANLCQSYKYINREEDLGVEGLRKAKLSYQPDIILDKFTVTHRE